MGHRLIIERILFRKIQQRVNIVAEIVQGDGWEIFLHPLLALSQYINIINSTLKQSFF